MKLKAMKSSMGRSNPTGNGAHVLVPKRWRGADVKVVRTTEPDE